ncbi:hypothetical protein B0J11DRAFT_440548 [Dendryphion nanum]|uniref:Uncharacterized protein n=1 Tax=Dendryphion nanum TaxID=256645 RepID=A0A9P9DI82_9PLEO|nr:hypothetical protein B0J11DRAFT_440548 [Dendryphion nanum]
MISRLLSSALAAVTAFQTVIFAGVIVAPTLVASNVLTDLEGLKTTIENSSVVIASPDNAHRGWSLWSPSDVSKTADLVMNITTSILRVKFNFDVDQPSWLIVSKPVNEANATLQTPISTTSPVNLTLLGIDTPYINYVSSIMTLSAALITLGRAWHSEYNRPVFDSIDALQLSISTFQTSLLQAGLIHSNSTLRTIRATTSLEDAQTAWSKPLNLPGSSRASQAEKLNKFWGRRENRALKGSYYTHKDLWGRQSGARQSLEGKARLHDGIVRQEESVAAQRFNA